MIGLRLSLLLLMSATPAAATEVTGPAKAIDSTVIAINDQRIMLFGIDSVMRKQSCTRDGRIWQCWAAVMRELQTLVDQGPASCVMIGAPDPFGRLLARCQINGQSLSERLVRAGWAVARSSETTDYVAAEAEARKDKRGLWQGEFAMPGEFRRTHGIFVDRP
jgi:endonuclease YncB( thermonuclease family)